MQIARLPLLHGRCGREVPQQALAAASRCGHSQQCARCTLRKAYTDHQAFATPHHGQGLAQPRARIRETVWGEGEPGLTGHHETLPHQQRQPNA